MWIMPNNFAVKIGGNTYIDPPNLVTYKGEPLFAIKRSDDTGILGIDFDVFDSQGKRVTTFRNGIVVQGDADNYDIVSGHFEYIVKEKSSGRVIAQVKRRQVVGAELEVSVQLYTQDGFLFNATPEQTNFGEVTFQGNTFYGGGIAIDDGGGGFAIG